jgi:hypothetical protein
MGASRLLVLVPDGVVNGIAFAHKIHWMAAQEQRDVLYLALYENNESKLTAMRWMVTMTAVTRDSSLGVETKLVAVCDWLKVLQEEYRAGDVILCHAEQQAQVRFGKMMPLRDFLQTRFQAPISTIAGFYQPEQILATRYRHNLLFWLGCLVMLVGFSFLEFRVDFGTNGFIRPMLLITLIALEMGLIWAWSHVNN